MGRFVSVSLDRYVRYRVAAEGVFEATGYNINDIKKLTHLNVDGVPVENLKVTVKRVRA